MMGLALALAVSGMGGEDIFASSIEIPQLAAICAETAKDPLVPNLCTGYILGTLDDLSSNGLICPTTSTGLTVRALEIGRKALADHATRSDQPPARVIGAALKKAFPCGTLA